MVRVKEAGVFFLLVLCCALAAAGIAKADHTGRRADKLNSKGIMKYSDDKVVIDSSDLTYLADEIDTLENNYKIEVLSALNGIGTFIKDDGSVTHHTTPADSNGALYAFKVLTSAIHESQSSGTAIADLSGDTYFKTAGGRLITGSSGADTAGAEAVDLSAASADDMSAGTVAYIDGKMLLGTGADNEAYYNIGYADGYAQKMDGLDIQIKYHEHTEACYGERDDMQCIVSLSWSSPYIAHCAGCQKDDPNGTTTFMNYTLSHSVCGSPAATGRYCTAHGPFYGGPPVGYTHTYSGQGLICGKTEETVESATILYP